MFDALVSLTAAFRQRCCVMKKPAKRPMMSGDARDKVYACLNYRDRSDGDDEWQEYIEACAWWRSLLSEDHKEIVRLVIDVWDLSHRHHLAERLAAELPPAPKCPS
jgi:hypothetical protein